MTVRSTPPPTPPPPPPPPPPTPPTASRTETQVRRLPSCPLPPPVFSTVGPYVSEEYNCTDYDDDTYFTPDVCSGYDYSTCYGDNSIVSNCVDSFWCNKLCGDMCDEGAGAICFFQKISDLQTTCSTVANLRATQNQTTNPWSPDGLSAPAERAAEEKETEEKKEKTSCGKGCSAATEMAAMYVPGPARDVSPEEAKAFMELYPRSSTVSDAAETGHGLSDDIADEGCGRHSYCLECTDFCKEKLMKKYLSNKFGVDTGAGVGGYSPSSLKQALENIVETCAYFGMYV